MRMLELFCGAGGATTGYRRAGWEVIGVDVAEQPHWPGHPGDFYQADWLEFFEFGGWDRVGPFDAVHASPPCQGYSNLRKGDHPRLIGEVRELLASLGVPYVIENIMDARPAMHEPIQLCGSMFGLRVQRHRLFECSFPVSELLPPHAHGVMGRIRAYYGKKGWLVWIPAAANVQKAGRLPLLRGSVADAPTDMGIDWMTWDELREAIPPAYTEWIGRQLVTAHKAD